MKVKQIAREKAWAEGRRDLSVRVSTLTPLIFHTRKSNKEQIHSNARLAWKNRAREIKPKKKKNLRQALSLSRMKGGERNHIETSWLVKPGSQKALCNDRRRATHRVGYSVHARATRRAGPNTINARRSNHHARPISMEVVGGGRTMVRTASSEASCMSRVATLWGVLLIPRSKRTSNLKSAIETAIENQMMGWAARDAYLIPRSMCSWMPKPKHPVSLKFLLSSSYSFTFKPLSRSCIAFSPLTVT